MAQSRFRDAYVVVSLLDKIVPMYNEYLTFDDQIVYNANGIAVGTTQNFIEDTDKVKDLLYVLRRDGVAPINAEIPVFANWTVMEHLELYSGLVIAVQGDLAIVYLGAVELNDDVVLYDREHIMVDGLEEERYSLTEEGLKYLKAILEEEVFETECECVCPEEREENSTMDNLFGSLGFGKIRGSRFKLSMNGIAVEQANGKYVVYNKDNNEFVDVSSTLIDIKDALFVLPAVEVNPGDTVLHEGKAYYIVNTTNEIKAVSYEDCTQTVLIPKSTMFGIKYFTKIFSMFGDNFAATGDLFNNPMMLMALMEGKNNDLTQLMLLNSMSNGDLGSNPMALAMMLKGDKSDDSLATIAMMSMLSGGTNPFAPKKKTVKASAQEK